VGDVRDEDEDQDDGFDMFSWCIYMRFDEEKGVELCDEVDCNDSDGRCASGVGVGLCIGSRLMTVISINALFVFKTFNHGRVAVYLGAVNARSTPARYLD
jgi:hypothetical protein